jgi:hypothetical protein
MGGVMKQTKKEWIAKNYVKPDPLTNTERQKRFREKQRRDADNFHLMLLELELLIMTTFNYENLQFEIKEMIQAYKDK